MIFFLVSCGGKQTNAPADLENTNTDEPSPATTEKVDQLPIPTDVVDFLETVKAKYFRKNEGSMFVKIKDTDKNGFPTRRIIELRGGDAILTLSRVEVSGADQLNQITERYQIHESYTSDADIKAYRYLTNDKVWSEWMDWGEGGGLDVPNRVLYYFSMPADPSYIERKGGELTFVHSRFSSFTALELTDADMQFLPRD